MAGKYEKLYKKQFPKNKTPLEKTDSTLRNYKARLEASGINPDKVLDDRNFLEKKLNLGQKQGLIKDLFEVLNRPQQALFGGIAKSQEGGDFLEGAKEGITGNKDTQFKEILMNSGTFNDRKGKLDLVDVLGFAGDVFLDPMDVAFVPVKGATALSKSAKMARDVQDIAKVGSKVDDVADVARAVDKVKDVSGAAKAVDKVNDNVKYLKEIKSVMDDVNSVVPKKLPKEPILTKDLRNAINNPESIKAIENVTKTKKPSRLANTKVLDKNGKPLQMYHGSTVDFDKFDKNKIRPVDFDAPFNGFWFSSNKNTSPAFENAKYTKNVYLDIKNPAPYDVRKKVNDKIEEELSDFYSDAKNINKKFPSTFNKKSRSVNDELRYRLQDLGYDGVHWDGLPDINWDELNKKGKTSFTSVRGSKKYKLEKLSKTDDAYKIYPNGFNLLDENGNVITSFKNIDDYKNIQNEEWVAFEPKQIINSDKLNKPKELKGLEKDLLNAINNPYGSLERDVLDSMGKPNPKPTKLTGLEKDIVDNMGKPNPLKLEQDIIDNMGKAPNNIDLEKALNETLGVGKFDSIGSSADIDKGLEELKNAPIQFKSINDLIGHAIGKGVKKGLKITDKGIENVLKSLDETFGVDAYDSANKLMKNKVKLKYGNLDSKNASNLIKTIVNPEDFNRLVSSSNGRLEEYRKIKDEIKGAFVKSEGAVKAILSGRNADNLSKQAKGEIIKLARANTDKIDEYARKVGKTSQEVGEDITLLMESYMDRNITKDKLIDALRKGDIQANPEIINAIYDIRNKLPKDFVDMYGKSLDFTIDDAGKIKLGNGWNKELLSQNGIKNLSENEFDLVNYGNWYTKNDLKKLDELKNDKEFIDLYQKVSGTFDEANKIIDKSGLGTNLFGKYGTKPGYVSHTYANPDLYKEFKDNGEAIIKGKGSIMYDRTRLGSMREQNHMWAERFSDTSSLTDKQLKFYENNPKEFEENFMKAFTNRYFDDLPNLAKQNKIVNDVLIEQSFNDYDEILKLQSDMRKYSQSGDVTKLKETNDLYNKLVENSNIKYLNKFDNKVPRGFTRITTSEADEIVNKFDRIGEKLGNSPELDKLKKILRSNKDVAINNDVLRMIEVSTDPKQTRAVSRLYDKWLNLFKVSKTSSPTFLMNNLTGNMSNLALGGVSVTDQVRLGPKAFDIVTKGQNSYIKKMSGQTLSKSEEKLANLWSKFLETGFGSDEVAYKLQDMPESIRKILDKKIDKQNILTITPYINMKLNTVMDNTSRVMVMLKSMENPNFLNKLGVEDVQQAISKIMFDPSMMTDFERKTMKRIIPFYTYTKNNMIYHLGNMQNNLSRYERTLQTVENLQKGATGNNEENMADFLKDSLYIPVPSLKKDGSYTVVRAQLPFGQIIDTFNNPVEELVNVSNPLIKGAYEAATGVNTFTGRPIENFEGEKSKNIPFMTKKAENILGNFSGLDVPLKNTMRAYNGIKDGGVGQGLKDLVSMENNINTDRLYRNYDQIDELQTLMKQYEQDGYEFSTINELKQANKNNKIASIDAILRKYNIE